MLEFKNVSYVYGEHTPFRKVAADNVSFKITDGSVTGIIGHTGSGKSTVAQLMNAIIQPTSGEIYFNGQNIADKNYNRHNHRFKVGLVLQYPEYQLFEETVEKDIAFGPSNMGLAPEKIKERVLQAAEFTKIPASLLKKSPFELSGGQKRRVAIAGVIAMDPEILVLDEPAAGLDPKGRSDILGGLCEYRKQRGNTMVIISHSMEDIATYSDNILAMSCGKVLCSGTPGEVFSHNDELKASGLSLPQLNDVLNRLNNMGLKCNQSVYTLDEAYEELKSILKK